MAYRRHRSRPLNVRQQKFVEQFLLTGIGREAAMRAGYSPANATETACRLRKLPYIAEAIRQGRANEARRSQVARERVLMELARVAFSDIGEVLDWTGDDDITLRPKAEISPHHRAAIAEIAPRRLGKGPRIKFHNKARALDTLARILGVYDKTVPAVDPAERRRDAKNARAILLERLARLKRAPDKSADSLNAGAPLGVPAFENSALASPPPIPSPSRGEGNQKESPSPLEGEGCLALASPVAGEPYAKLGEGSSSSAVPVAARTSSPAPPSPGRTFPPGFGLPPK